MKRMTMKCLSILLIMVLVLSACSKKTDEKKNEHDSTEKVTEAPEKTSPEVTDAPEDITPTVTAAPEPSRENPGQMPVFEQGEAVSVAYYYINDVLERTEKLQDLYDLDTLTAILQVNYPVISKDSAEAHPGLAAAYDSYVNSVKNDAAADESSMKAWAEDMLRGGAYYGFNSKYAVSDALRADTSVVTVEKYEKSFTYEGENEHRDAVVFDTQTGKVLNIADIFASGAKKDEMVDYVLGLQDEEQSWVTPEYIWECLNGEGDESFSFGLGYDSLRLYFNMWLDFDFGEITRSLIYDIPFDKFESSFKADYIGTAEQYGAELSNDSIISVRDNYTGELTSLFCYIVSDYDYDSDAYTTHANIYYNNEYCVSPKFACEELHVQYYHIYGENYVFVYPVSENIDRVYVMKLDTAMDAYAAPYGEYNGPVLAGICAENAADILHSASFKTFGTVSAIEAYAGRVHDFLYDEEDSEDLVFATNAVVWISEEDGKKYSKLNSALESFSRQNAEAYKDELEELKGQAVLDKEDGYFYGPYSTDSSYTITRADSNVFSFVGESSYYSGGAHPFYGVGGYTLDTATGEKLPLKAAVTDLKAFENLLVERIEEDWGDDIYDSFDLRGYVSEAIKNDSLNFSVGYDNITVYFSPYEIAPYASGVLQEAILFAEAPGMFAEKITEIPACYMSRVPLYDNNRFFDAADQGIVNYTIVPVVGEYGDFTAVEINSGSDSTTIGLDMGYFIDAYLLKTAKDNYYLVLSVLGGSDDNVLYVVNIGYNFVYSCGRLDYVCDIHSTRRDYGEDIYYSNDAVFSPAHIKLESRLDILGTTFEYAEYNLSSDPSVPVRLSKEYYSTYTYPLTLLEEVQFEKLDKDGYTGTGEYVNLPAGTELKLYASDNKFYIDFTGSGGTYRLHTEEKTEWCFYVNGTPAYEFFDGVSFAD